jgi:SAM-dependent methyltransferase
MSNFYHTTKNLALKLIPNHLLHRLEPGLRRIAAIPYYGNKYHCNICKTSLKQFIHLDRGDELCPVCGSLPRHRRLWDLLHTDLLPKGKVLHFSPSRPMAKQLRATKSLNYLTTDYEDKLFTDVQYDITAIPEENNSFDQIICYHVLEHIPDDQAAMKELYRILKPNGHILIQTPFKEGDIYENESVQTAAERLQHFGQEDHVRIYSAKGLKERLEKTGFKVQTLTFHESDEKQKKLQLKKEETILVARK